MNAIGLLDGMNRDDVRVIERGECPRLPADAIETISIRRDMGMILANVLPRMLERIGASDSTAAILRVEAGIYWAQRANRAKRAWLSELVAGLGEYLSQAGVGVELIFKNDKDEIVAKFRHSGREGNRLQDAAEEIVEDIVRFIEQR